MKKICTRCQRIVFQPEEKCAFGKVWHSFCFSCYMCNKLLDCTNVQIAKEDLYCTDCFFRLKRDDDDDDDQCQCPSEQCIQSLSSRVRSTDDLADKCDGSDVQSTNEFIYPCTIPVPYSVSAWYNRQHKKRMLPIKPVFCVPSCQSCKMASVPEYKGDQEPECTCAPPSPSSPSPSSPSHLKDTKPDTTSETSVRSKKVSFEPSNKEQRLSTGECSQSKVSATSPTSSRHSGRSGESRILNQKKVSSTTYNVNCHCSHFKPIETIKEALQQSVMASLEPKRYHCINAGSSTGSPRGVKYGSHIPLGGGMDCRRCGRKVYFAEMFTVPGAVYHDICFCCLDCRKPLEVTTVYATHGDIYCKLCYIRNFGPIGYGYGQGSGALLSPNP